MAAMGDLPPFTCICELCDCGRHKHHKNCTKQTTVQRRGGPEECRISHYKSTYTNPINGQPRSSKRPLRTPPHPKHTDMMFTTTQRAEFVPKELGERTRPYVPKEFYESPQEPLQSQTLYNLHFAPKEPVATTSRRPPSNLHPNQARFEDTTTSKDFYKDWKGGRQARYGELPTMAGSVLFPGQAREMKTITQEHFVEKSLSKPELVKNIQANITIEGDHNMTTTNQSTYYLMPLEKPAGRRQPQAERAAVKRPHVEIVTKYQSDFPEYRSLPARAHPAYPPLDNLAINHSFSNNYQTVQNETYPGWDTTKHHRPDLIRLKEELASMNKEKGGMFEGDTVTKLSYPPPPPNKVLLEPLKRPTTTIKTLNARFEDATASKFFFQNWGAQPRIRHGDCQDGISLRPLPKLENETTTGSTYLPKKGERVRNCKPEHDSIEILGDQDFSTVHRETYRSMPLHVCRMETYLKQQKENMEHAGPLRA
ncbi:stabilizer of axonemal microtubules 1-like [Ambystoma mexicanum]|uniref:stabilizer of axonemal microtubules 1-like n=1 Tax=Ambystoma mexicanum TaxID=8296 RepID=UPI0037E80A63